MSDELLKLATDVLDSVKDIWREVDDVALVNSARVIQAFKAEKISQVHLNPSTGYAYSDPGRDALERVYARVFGAEAACVSSHWVSGTHVLATALRGLLRPGDELLSLTGNVYETLKPVIGIDNCGENRTPPSRAQRGQGLTGKGLTLKDIGVTFRQADVTGLTAEGEGRRSPEGLEKAVSTLLKPDTKVVFIQRSRGYSMRRPCSVREIGEMAQAVHRVNPEVVVLVDNCYGEFTEVAEPSMVGADVVVGSLIKNPGGGLSPIGGYAVGREDLIGAVKEALYAPGIGTGVGANPLGYRPFFQGLFIAPHVVAEALKGSIFASSLFERLGYLVSPAPEEKRSDIVQCIVLGTPDKVKVFARAIQSCSPVDSHATPEPWHMPGYGSDVIMAAGTFVDGSSIELSCDAPFEPPYAVYLQGGLFKEHVIMATLVAAAMVGPASKMT
ncbi:MAG: methionine gamma-lyase family protein [Firmicutes bacterium]|nr:methionine gamma-lyase family protein [Candidatus Fermentithermobacillaceae bacterium]